ncbi:MAG: molybdate ABC transporter permease subunit [Betaproteobacteria bacterium]|nr:molybdate ABC transporter permease subunit [Betaproteobacteria bacterium]
MDWTALTVSLKLAAATLLVLIPAGLFLARALAWHRFRGRAWLEAALTLPLVLPPTVLGYYLLTGMGAGSPLGAWFQGIFGAPLAFSFTALVLASVIFNLPFALIPMQRAFEAIPREVLEAAQSCGMSRARTLWRIELPLAWPGIISAVVMCAAHTIGEFGVVLMVGGSIPGETRTIAIAIYDRVQAFDLQAAGVMSAALLFLSLAALAFTSRVGGTRLTRP